MHKKLRAREQRWNKMHLPLRRCQVLHSDDGDCAFVAFAQGLQQVTLRSGPRKLRKVAFSRLHRNARY